MIHSNAPSPRLMLQLTLSTFDRQIDSTISFFEQYWFVFAIGGAVVIVILYILARRRINYVARYNRKIRHPKYAIRLWHCCCCGPKLEPGENPFNSESDSEEEDSDVDLSDLEKELLEADEDEYSMADDFDFEFAEDRDRFEDARDFDDMVVTHRSRQSMQTARSTTSNHRSSHKYSSAEDADIEE